MPAPEADTAPWFDLMRQWPNLWSLSVARASESEERRSEARGSVFAAAAPTYAEVPGGVPGHGVRARLAGLKHLNAARLTAVLAWYGARRRRKSC